MAASREEIHDIYDRLACAVYDAMESMPNEKEASELEGIYLKLAGMREKYDALAV